MLQLTGRQKKLLRAKAHSLNPVVQVGQDGVSDAVLQAIDAALLAHELIKVRLHAPTDKRGMAEQIAGGCEAALCGLIGHTLILYRPHPEKPRIVV